MRVPIASARVARALLGRRRTERTIHGKHTCCPDHDCAGGENPGGWPEVLLPLFERAITVEYASFTRAGAPITYPVTPYVGEDGLTLDVSTGLTYPSKAERAR